MIEQKVIADGTLATGVVTMPMWVTHLETTGTVALIFLGCAVALFRIIIMRAEYKRLQEKPDE